MNINELLKQWHESIEKAQSEQVGLVATDDLYRIQGMHLRSDVHAGLGRDCTTLSAGVQPISILCREDEEGTYGKYY